MKRHREDKFWNPESQILRPEEIYEKKNQIQNPASWRQIWRDNISNPKSQILCLERVERLSRIPNPKSCALNIHEKITFQIPNPKSWTLQISMKRTFKIPNPASWRDEWTDNYSNPESQILCPEETNGKTISEIPNPKSCVLKKYMERINQIPNPKSCVLKRYRKKLFQIPNPAS